MRRRLATSLAFALGALPIALAASADEISLRPRYQPGDAYVLSLSAVKNAELVAPAGRPRPFREDVHLRYEANVAVLETDAAGLPVRERHRDVTLSYVRPDGSGSLFQGPASFEVRRADGAVQVFVHGQRAERKLEAVIAGLLQGQYEYGIGAMLDPGHPLAEGDSWEIEPARVKEFLNQRGVKEVRFAEPGSARLARAENGALVVHYSIPIKSFRPSTLPASARAAHSQGSLEGELRLDPESLRSPLRHSSKLALRMNGSVFGGDVARSFPWQFRSSEALDQHTLTVRREVAASF